MSTSITQSPKSAQKRKRHVYRFTPADDTMIRILVCKYGTDFDSISREMGEYKPNQIRDRYKNYLKPGTNQAAWTVEEDRKLMSLVEHHGHRWKEFSSFFEGRSPVNIKNRFIQITVRGQSPAFPLPAKPEPVSPEPIVSCSRCILPPISTLEDFFPGNVPVFIW